MGTFLVGFLALQALIVKVFFFFFFVVEGHIVPFADEGDVRQDRWLLERFSPLGCGITKRLHRNIGKKGIEDAQY